MAKPIVSVIMPVRNGEPYFAAALTSVLEQQDVDFELIVVDDGSTDGTPALLANCVDPRLRVLKGGGLGVGGALAMAQAAAQGEFVARMDADDLMLPGRLALQAWLLADNPDAALVHCSVRVIDANGREIGPLPAQQFDQDERRAVLLEERAGLPIIHPGVMMRRSMLEAAGGYRPIPSEDHELWLRLIEQGRFIAMPEELLLYRRHESSVTSSRHVEPLLIHLVSCVAARHRKATGIDLYIDRPQDWAALQKMADHLARRWMECFVDSRQVRRLFGARKPLQAIAAWIKLALRGEPLLIFLPIALAHHRQLQRRLLAKLEQFSVLPH